MKHFLLMVFLIFGYGSYCQKITINKDLKVKTIDFEIKKSMDKTPIYNSKVGIVRCFFKQDTLNVVIGNPGIIVECLQLKFVKGKIVTDFFYCTDQMKTFSTDFNS